MKGNAVLLVANKQRTVVPFLRAQHGKGINQSTSIATRKIFDSSMWSGADAGVVTKIVYFK